MNVGSRFHGIDKLFNINGLIDIFCGFGLWYDGRDVRQKVKAASKICNRARNHLLV